LGAHAGIGLAAVYAAVRLRAATGGSPTITPDSFDYAWQSHQSVFWGASWGSQHPPLLPFLWKLDPGASSVVTTPKFFDVRPLVIMNVVMGVVCWKPKPAPLKGKEERRFGALRDEG
jgi:hypothetical protein